MRVAIARRRLKKIPDRGADGMSGFSGRGIGRRALLAAAGVVAGAVALTGGAADAFAQDKARIKVAGVYTVPIEQQWVSRIHKALKAAEDRGEIEYVWSENVADTDYERVMREYAEAGQPAYRRRGLRGRGGRRARSPRTIPKTAFLMGSSFGPAAAPNFVGVRQLHPGAGLPTGIIAGAMTKSGKHRHGRRLSDPGGQPPDERLHGGRARRPTRRSSSRSPSSARGSIRPRPRRPPSPRSTRARTSCMPSASACRTPPRSAACWRSATSSTPRRTIPRPWSPRALWHFEPTHRRAPSRRCKGGKFKAEDYGLYSFMKRRARLAPLGTFERQGPGRA